MPRFLPFLLLNLTLLTAACQKEDAKPAEAPLEGRWTPDSSFDYNYSATGAFVSKTSITVTPNFYLRITSDSLSYRATVGNYSLGHYKLFRQDKNLTFGRLSCTIMELTDHKLVLHFKALGVPPGGAYTEQEDVYTR
ncbi:hypothetical protein MUN84_01355 [Hymenobacter sp. 5516J-16]|uniref:hypothetical protein n=1 Tax=Hymenobacter sp. 5516J-16 TaxID=2932253 RepID=UPI001FD0DEC0|nr:hypothetical protein [Hymenobacter sp. 5516J-16]UOQ77395.1 hypothetical protein MUN84_01355 [Hymenobacter sp. 5516J-16]